MLRPLFIIVLAAASLVVALFMTGFLYTMFTGQQLIEPDPAPPTPPTEELAEQPTPDPRPSDPGLLDPTPSDPPVRIPAGLTPEGVASTLLELGLWSLVDDELTGDPAAFASLTVDHALRLYEPLANETGDLEALRLHLFAWLSYLPAEERAEFADAVGAVFPTATFFNGPYRGDFVGLFYMQTEDPDAIFAVAVRRYAAVFESDAILDALVDFGAVLVEPDNGTWRIRVEERMQSFDARTLLALRERIDLFFGLGDRKYLRAELADLAASKSPSD